MSIFNFIFVMLVSISNASANESSLGVGMVTAASGVAELLSLTNDTSDAQSKVLFEGKKYLLAKARLGMKVKEGDMLRTGTDGKMKVIFTNGDVLVVSPSTAITVPGKKEKAQAKPKSELLYGMMRAVVDPKGPRSGLEVKTTSAVAGVRGTDFCVGFNPGLETTQVMVIRGQADLTKIQASAPAIEVKTGQKSEVSVEAKAPAQVISSTREDLLAIQKDTTILPIKDLEVSKDDRVQVAALEAKAVENTIADIKRYQPEVAKEILAKGVQTSDQVNSRVVLDLYKSAPGEALTSKSEVAAKAKPRSKDLEGADDDVYKKYFEGFVK